MTSFLGGINLSLNLSELRKEWRDTYLYLSIATRFYPLPVQPTLKPVSPLHAIPFLLKPQLNTQDLDELCIHFFSNKTDLPLLDSPYILAT